MEVALEACDVDFGLVVGRGITSEVTIGAAFFAVPRGLEAVGR